MADDIDESRLHQRARDRVVMLCGRGAQLDKRQLRFNDIVSVGVFYANCGAVPLQAVAEAGVDDAVDACIVGSASYIKGGSVLSLVQPWMAKNG